MQLIALNEVCINNTKQRQVMNKLPIILVQQINNSRIYLPLLIKLFEVMRLFLKFLSFPGPILSCLKGNFYRASLFKRQKTVFGIIYVPDSAS
jgi:hypothetical protein